MFLYNSFFLKSDQDQPDQYLGPCKKRHLLFREVGCTDLGTRQVFSSIEFEGCPFTGIQL